MVIIVGLGVIKMLKHKINPRGIIKWHPFAAVTDPARDLDKLDAINNALIMPELSEEQIEEYNRDLTTAYNMQAEVFVSWFSNGKIGVATGVISRVDTKNSILHIDNKEIPINNIVEVL